MSEERLLEDELLELIGHRFRRGLINVIDLANLELTPNAVERSDSVVSLTRIKNEALQALSVVDAVLSLAQRDKTPVPCAPFDLAALVRQVTPKLQRQVADMSAMLTVEVPESPLEVLGIREYLWKMLPLLLEFALWQLKSDRLHLQIAPDSAGVRLSLQFDTSVATSNAISGESMPLTNLLSLWSHTRMVTACGGRVYYAPVALTHWKLYATLPSSISL